MAAFSFDLRGLQSQKCRQRGSVQTPCAHPALRVELQRHQMALRAKATQWTGGGAKHADHLAGEGLEALLPSRVLLHQLSPASRLGFQVGVVHQEVKVGQFALGEVQAPDFTTACGGNAEQLVVALKPIKMYKINFFVQNAHHCPE